MTDSDDALRRELGWTGPEESDFEPESATTEPTFAPRPQVPRRPPVDYVPARPAGPASQPDDTAGSAPDERPSDDSDDLTVQIPEQELPRGSFGSDPVHLDQPEAENRPQQQQPPWPPPPPGWQPAPGPQPPGPQPPVPPVPHMPPGQPWPSGTYGPEGAGDGGPSSYADRIRVDQLVPQQRTPPGRGWRLWLYKASFGLINLGPSPDEIREAELEEKIKSVLRGHYKVGVMGKGGAGKTTVSACIGSIFAELRQEDRVVAIDADTSFGKLGSRIDPKAQSSYWELAGDQHLDSFADVRGRVGNNAAGLFVLAGEGTPARRRVLDPAIYREATSRLDQYFSISIIDCSSTMDSPVTQEVLRDLDALIVVSSPWVDAAATAGQTMDWLANRGMTNLLRSTVVVLNDSDGHADKRTRSILTQQFSGHGQAVIEVPFDGHLRPGGVIDRTALMSPATRRRFVEIAAALADRFPSQDDRSRERH